MAEPDFARVFGKLIRIARTAESVQAGWRGMCAIAEKAIDGAAADVATLDLQRDSTHLRIRLEAIMKDKPPPNAVDTLLFGLFDAASSEGGDVQAGYYVAGITGFDPDDGDSICDPAWWPDDRYFRSEALDAILAVATRSDEPSQHTMLAYALTFGAAALISRFAAKELPYRVVVAFDEGDFAEVVPLADVQPK